MASTNADAIRATKRKLDQAFLILDDAVNSKEPADNPPPKRIHTSGSLYSTLAKYGIKFNSKTQPRHPAEHLLNSTPNLSAILSRTASRIRRVPPFRLGNQSSPFSPLPITAEYRPSSVSSFLARLATFKLSTYSNKPVAIDAVAASKCGWINDGKDRLVCSLCKSSWVVARREGMTREAANALLEKQRVSLVEAHKDGCPWKRRQCDDSIYCVPLQTPAVLVRVLKQNANALDPLLGGVVIKHPLAMKQLESLHAVIASFALTSPFEPHPQEGCSASRPTSPTPEDGEPSHNAVLTALFGWSIIPSTIFETPPGRTRASSVASSVTPPRTPSISRTGPYLTSPTTTPPSISMLSLNGAKPPSHENALLHCPLCQRRVGLWAFAPQSKVPAASSTIPEASIDTSAAAQRPQRPFDLVKEHRSFCPYVVRSTVVPSLPISPSATVLSRSSASGHERTISSASLPGTSGGNIEGWRAVLTIILRYDMKQRLVYDPLSSETADQAFDNEPMEIGAVKAMVNEVKSRGGRDLLMYVRNLLG
ncbi:hypothetical protein APHAL10511_007449 [Amanita phalloides]|nr:hypothetical protein APHAL10511_007449 [Amanita phalloides]